jgi:ubiquinone/menaquinone biosynthesis C-methylase UbiE
MVNIRNKHEIDHFSYMDHIWWGAKTVAGQKRYDNKFEKMGLYCGSLKGKMILEIGSGDGEFTKRFNKSGAKLVATDLTPKVVKRGKKNIKFMGLKFKVEDACDLTFKDKTFDIVCGVSILHHVDTGKALKEAFRVLKEGGQIFFTEPNIFNPNVFLGLNIPYLRKKMEFSPDESAFTRFYLATLLESLGYSNVRVKNYDFLHPLTPESYIDKMRRLSGILEKTPLVKEISGSLLIYAEK